MSDQTIIPISSSTHSLFVGVIKYDYKTLGYPEVYKIALELSKDKNFLEVLVRKVSAENWGIQLLLALPKSELPEGMKPYSYFRNTYDNMLSKAYAMDLSVSDAGSDHIQENWLVQKPFVLAKE